MKCIASRDVYSAHPQHASALSLLLAGSGIFLAFTLYGRAGAQGQQVNWAPERGLRAFLFNRWYQDNLYEKIFPVGFTLLLMKALAWFDQNILDGIVNGVGRSDGIALRVWQGASIPTSSMVW